MGKSMKVRRLVFADDDEGRDRYMLLYQGFLNGGNNTQTKGMEVVRREAKMLERFQNAGLLPPDDLSSNEMNRALIPGGATVELDGAEYDLLKKYFEGTPWVTRLAIKVVNVSDWLNSLPLEDTNG